MQAGADISHHGGPAYPKDFDYSVHDPSFKTNGYKDVSLANGTNGDISTAGKVLVELARSQLTSLPCS